MLSSRIRHASLLEKIVTKETAASWIEDGMTIGFSGFTSSGDAKEIPVAIAERARAAGKPFKINVYTGASVAPTIDSVLADYMNIRLPFQSDKDLRKSINKGNVNYIDQHLSETGDALLTGAIPSVDIAVVEALAITEDGSIIPTTSGGNTHNYIKNAKEVIVELNLAQPLSLEGVHDIYDIGAFGERKPIPLQAVDDRVGRTSIPTGLDKIKGIVITEQLDTPKTLVEPDEETSTIARHLLNFLRDEIKAGRLSEKLPPLQSGVGSVANAVFHGFLHSEFHDLELYSEVLQDSVFDLIDAGKIRFASGGALTLSKEKMDVVLNHFENYRDKMMLRPQDMSNNPEIIRRLGLITINTAIEVDIYGNVNSTHIMGNKMMNGIGGSGDFTRNARLSIFVTKSIAKNGDISSIVPFISHVDHTEHDVMVVVTEQGVADLRGLTPRQRAIKLIENCAHPSYREQLYAYFNEASQRGGQTPHVLEKAFAWHVRFNQTGSMREGSTLPLVEKEKVNVN
ncbi:succinate CoA transferase [Aneurinibacillus uraniidurans]|uniref:succinate CoA transferase n=1 Tax=Aneurinibacillus uraniidurans TaxID=2966586 RepID=UPI002349A3ED|nr:succinate CoA transferase [Aneurinibacillus sp. B1]WCN37852.1 succinate CoA transferase [Aneurinibacillus sp. B1]